MISNKNSAMISVIVPVYKVEQYLDNCIHSIVQQTYDNLEIIPIDDGSPDRCGEICDRCSERDTRICVIHKKIADFQMLEILGLKGPPAIIYVL